MSRSQKYISILLERLPKWELRSYEHQTSLDRIRDRISSASDIQAELLTLFQVKGFSDFALSLMWIADKVEKDPTLEESTLGEETLVFSNFRQALGDVPPPTQESTPTEAKFGLPTSQGIGSMPTAEPAPTPDVLLTSWGTVPQTPTTEQPMGSVPSMGSEQERNFARLMEQFLESIQSGNDNRTTLMSNVLNECKTVIATGSATDDYKCFCQLLMDFLQYISDNQYLDDVRVMNIVSNIQDPVTQWSRSEQKDRAGVLDQANDILRDFKTMFE